MAKTDRDGCAGWSGKGLCAFCRCFASSRRVTRPQTHCDHLLQDWSLRIRPRQHFTGARKSPSQQTGIWESGSEQRPHLRAGWSGNALHLLIGLWKGQRVFGAEPCTRSAVENQQSKSWGISRWVWHGYGVVESRWCFQVGWRLWKGDWELPKVAYALSKNQPGRFQLRHEHSGWLGGSRPYLSPDGWLRESVSLSE